MMRSKRKKKNFPAYLTLLCLVLACSSLVPARASDGTGQQTAVKGMVTDAGSREGLPGVSIVIKGTTKGTITDMNGNYSIDASPTDILLFSFIGYVSQEITVGNLKEINVALATDVVNLTEVVFIGYGTQRRSDLTGAVTPISSKELKAQPVSSIDQALQGRAAGVLVQQTSGSPAGGVSVLVRGSSSINASSQPLYVVDGIPISSIPTGGTGSIQMGQGGQNSNPLATLAPEDIESIEILKDASATAIYGAQGANGVVLISTRRGKSGQNTISFNSYMGFQQLPKKLSVLNSMEYARYRLLLHHSQANSSTYPVYETPFDITDDRISFTTLHPDSFPVNTNWQNEMYQTALIQNYHLSATGGSERIGYSLSGGFFQNEGILIGSDYKRYSFSAIIDAKMNNWFQMGNTALFSYSYEDMTFNDAYYGGGLVERALQQRPDMAVYDSLGNYATPDASMSDTPTNNPIYEELEKQNSNAVTRMVGNIYGQINFTKWLFLNSKFGTDLASARTTIFTPEMDLGSTTPPAEMQEEHKQNIYWSWDNVLNFNKNFGIHEVTATLGMTRYYTKWDQFQAYRSGFPNNDNRNIHLGSRETMENDAYAGDYAGEAYLARVNYSFKKLLSVTSSFRQDRSSKFDAGRNKGNFSSFAVAYKLSEHDFMRSLTFIDFMKVRVGYGQTGNQNLDINQYKARLAAVTVIMGGDAIVPAFQPAGKDNPFLQWETVNTYNAGIDMNMFRNRIQLNTDFYIKQSKDMLFILNLPITSSPFGSPWSNSGSMVNRGMEVNLITHNTTGTLSWSTTLTYSLNYNKAIDLKGSNIDQRIRTQDPMITRTSEGYPVAQFYGFVTDGIFRSREEIEQAAFQNVNTAVGDIRFKDINKDNVIDDNDKTYIGNPLPRHVFGLTNNFSYKGFDLSIFIQGMQGNKVFNMMKRRMEGMNTSQNQYSSVLNAYNPEDVYLETPYGSFLVAEANTDTDIPRMTSTDRNENTRISDRYVEDGSFVKIQTITLGYTLPATLTKKMKGSSLRVYVTGKNLYTITKYSGYEPEHGAINNNGLLTGIDIGNYPIPRSVVVGVNLNF